jgi:hypothetical protein
LKLFRNSKHNFGNEIRDKQNYYENYEFKYDPNVFKSMSGSQQLDAFIVNSINVFRKRQFVVKQNPEVFCNSFILQLCASNFIVVP